MFALKRCAKFFENRYISPKNEIYRKKKFEIKRFESEFE